MKYIRLFILLVLLLSSLPAEEKEKISSFAGITYVPVAFWSFPSIFNLESADDIKYHMDDATFLSYDANVHIKFIETTFGLNAIVKENSYLNDIERFVGYIGIKRTYFRYSYGRISGWGEWHGPAAAGMETPFTYDNKIQSFDLFYMLKNSTPKDLQPYMTMGWYIGLGYTTFEAPIEVLTLTTPGGRENQVYGWPVYDKKYSIKAYSFIFGFDTMVGEIMEGKLKPGAIKFFGFAMDRIGFGSGLLSKETVEFAEELNPGHNSVGRGSFVAYLENDSTFGIFWAPSLFKAHAVIAIGYNLAFESVTCFGGAADNSDDLGFEPYFFMLRHGPQIRAYAAW